MTYTKKSGWINIHIDTTNGRVTCSNGVYSSEAIANTGIYIGQGIQKVACIQIEWDEKIEDNVV